MPGIMVLVVGWVVGGWAEVRVSYGVAVPRLLLLLLLLLSFSVFKGFGVEFWEWELEWVCCCAGGCCGEGCAVRAGSMCGFGLGGGGPG